MNTPPFVAHIVFTTHWDREWVQTFEQYRFRLVNLIDRLLDILEKEPSLIFTFDGQVIVVEDYLEVQPHQKARLQNLTEAGRLIFGPWYVLADQFLEGDEATVRNLLIGFGLCKSYGNPMFEGYVPDSFGSTSSLPLILNGFGIRYANFGRGSSGFPANNSNVCRWQAADGSEVLVFNHGYGNAIGLPFPDIWRDITKHTPTAESVRANASRILSNELSRGHRPLYFSAGIDHMEMRPGMSQMIELLNQSTDGEWISSTPFAFATALENDLRERTIELPCVRGEMRGSKEAPMDLQGVLSTNREVKRLNRLCEIILSRVLEPLNVAQIAVVGSDYHGSLTYAWKLLLQNHPHDSICACSIDTVVRDVLLRFHRVVELYDITRERILRNVLGTSFAGDGASEPVRIGIFNSIPHRNVASFHLLVRVPRRLEGESFELKNLLGEVVGVATNLGHRNNDLETFYATNDDLLKLDCKSPATNREQSEIFTLLDVRGTSDLGKALGWNVFELTTFESANSYSDTSHGADWINNSFLRVDMDELGQIYLHDLANGRNYGDLFWFEDSADIGDTYDYQALGHDIALISGAKGKPTAVTSKAGSEVRLSRTFELDIPIRSTKIRRDVSTLIHEIELILTLRSKERVLYAEVNFTNRSVNHRLRVGFRFREEPRLFSGGHFGAIARPFGKHGDVFPCCPMTDYLHLDFSQGSLGILTKGLYEFEPRHAQEGSEILVTLCRSTNSIGPAAGCNYPVDHAKELGRHKLELALVPSHGLTDTIRQAQAYTTPLIGEVLSIKESSNIGPILAFDNTGIILSALKRSEDRRGYIVRLFNPLEMNQKAILEFKLPYEKVERVELSEEVSSKGGVNGTGSEISLSLNPYEVMTIKFWIS